MFRRIELICPNPNHELVSFLYHVRGAKFLAENIVAEGSYSGPIGDSGARTPVVFNDSFRAFCYEDLPRNRKMVYMLDVDENQPLIERVEELTHKGASITVYNANGVVVCDKAGDLAETIDGSSEMTSEPIGGTGEMTSEPIDGIGEMTSEPIDGTGETI